MNPEAAATDARSHGIGLQPSESPAIAATSKSNPSVAREGFWTASDGHTEQDDVVIVEVVTETFDRGWWRTYSTTLAERFRQKKIHVRAVPVQMLDEDAI